MFFQDTIKQKSSLINFNDVFPVLYDEIYKKKLNFNLFYNTLCICKTYFLLQCIMIQEEAFVDPKFVTIE